MDKAKLDRNAFVHLYLFGLFAGGLILSQWMVASRSGIRLTGPIRLSGQGLTVAMPTGPGWQTLERWEYERDNSYALVGKLAVEPFARAEVRWQYLLAAEPVEPEATLHQQLTRLAMPHQEISRLSEEVDFIWTAVYPEDGRGGEAAIGLAALEPGRVLLLQVRAENQPLLAEELFRSLARSVHYKTTKAETAGRRLVEAAAQLDPETTRQLTRHAFIISDPAGRKIGYSITRAPEMQTADAWKLQLETTFQVDLGRTMEQYKEQLYVDPFLENLDWNCLLQGRGARQPLQYRLERLDNGSIRQEDSAGTTRILWPSAAAVPDVLVPLAAALLLQSEADEIALDVISCRGEVVPTRLTKIPPAEAAAKADNLHAAVRVDYLHREDNHEEIYFDETGTLIGKLEVMPGSRIRVWDRATEEEILFHFGNLFKGPGQSAQAGDTTGHLTF